MLEGNSNTLNHQNRIILTTFNEKPKPIVVVSLLYNCDTAFRKVLHNNYNTTSVKFFEFTTKEKGISKLQEEW
jgi:hypothetical protein